jgi:hypothetical protein
MKQKQQIRWETQTRPFQGVTWLSVSRIAKENKARTGVNLSFSGLSERKMIIDTD